jgi:Phosphate/sulphate permeases
MNDVLLVVVIVVALGFDFTNGFHDTANAIATSVSTRALPPRLAVLVASVANLVGAFATTAVATTVGTGIVAADLINTKTILAALFGAIAWNLLTWWFGLPSSSSHALIGGLVGAALVQSGEKGVLWHGLAHDIVIPALIAPVIAFGAAFVLLVIIYWVFRRLTRGVGNRGFRLGQLASGTFVAFTHGANDAQKTMGVIALALFTNGNLDTFEIPTWVKFAAGLAIAAGTYVAVADHADARPAAVQDGAAGRLLLPAHRRRRNRRRDTPRLSALDHARDLRGRARLRLDAPLPRRALGHRRQHRLRLVPDNSGRGPRRRGAVLAGGGDLLARPLQPNLPRPFTVPVPMLMAIGADSWSWSPNA